MIIMTVPEVDPGRGGGHELKYTYYIGFCPVWGEGENVQLPPPPQKKTFAIIQMGNVHVCVDTSPYCTSIGTYIRN